MKLRQALTAVAIAAGALASAPASANFSQFEDVGISLTAGAGMTWVLELTNVLSSTGTWANATFLDAVSFNNIGTVTGANYGGVLPDPGELNASGCTGGGSGKICFDTNFKVPVSDDMIMTFSYTGGALDLTGTGLDTPHLKMQFVNDAGAKIGSLYSADVPAVPEPETYAMMLAGLAAVGFMARRRKSA